MSFLKSSYIIFLGILISVLTACLPSVEQNILELASFIRSQANRTSGKIYVTVTGLQGTGLKLSLNETEDLSVSANSEVSFQTLITPGSTYDVKVKTQPTNPTQTCTVSGGSATLVSGDVKSIIVNCGAASYTLGGTITGLAGSGLVLSNGSDTVSISADGSFAFTTTYVSGTTYSVSVSTSPSHPGQTCAVTNASGTFSAANVTSIGLNCSTTGRAIRVTVSGIGSGNLVLQNNLSDSLTISSNGSAVFSNDVAIGGTYSVTISSTPSSHTCVLSSASGTIAASDATVTANCFSLLTQSPSNLSVLNTNQSIVFRFSDSVTNVSCTAGAGNLTTGGTTSFAVSTTVIANDTLTLSTSTTWNPASVKQDMTCTSAAGNSLAVGSVTFRYNIPSSIVYVSDTNGLDTNSGSLASPYKSIQKGIQGSSPCGTPPCVVLVEDGTYEAENAGLGVTFVTIVNNISIYGGYTAGTNFGSRNSSAKLTVIQKSSPTDCGGASLPLSPCKSVFIGNAVTNGTFVDGFKIVGPSSAADTVAVSITSGKVILYNNTIQAGTANNSAGLMLNDFGGTSSNDAAMGWVIGNTITGGSCTPVSCQTGGIFYYTTTASLFPFIQNNTITGGSCSSNGCKTMGFYSNTVNAANLSVIKLNTINGGTVSSSPGSSESIGVYLGNASTAGSLTGNSINGGTADTTIGLDLGASMPLSIGIANSGNAIYGGSGGSTSYGVRLTAGGTLNSNSIHAGNVNVTGVAATYGIYSSSGVISVTGNRIFGGNATGTGSSSATVNGIYINNLSAGSNFVRNHISAGNSSNTGSSHAFSYGTFIANITFALNITNNIIDGGTCGLSQSSNSCETYGLVLNKNSAASKVYHNTLYSGTAEDKSIPLYTQHSSSSLADIQNNILYAEGSAGTKYCLLHEGSANLGVLKGNVFFGCYPYVSYSTIGINADTFCSGGKISDSSCSDPNISVISTLNVLVDPVQTTTLTTYSMKYRNYSGYSPCAATQIANPLGAVTSDAVLASRPGGNASISAGALEYDGTCQ